MRRLLPTFLAALLWTPLPAAAQRPGQGHRAALEAQVLQRFMDRVSERLQLDPEQRGQLEQVLRDNEVQRRALQRDATTLRRDLADAVRNPDTKPGEFDRLLGRMADLRVRDAKLWRDEQSALAHVLSPRQRAEFIGLRLQFYEMVQRLRRQRGMPGGPPGPGPGAPGVPPGGPGGTSPTPSLGPGASLPPGTM